MRWIEFAASLKHRWLASCFLVLLLIGPQGLVPHIQAAESATKSPIGSAVSKKKTEPQKKSGRQFLRLSKDDKGKPLALEAAIVRFVSASNNNGKPTIVDLVGAVHIGEPEYYDRLNDEFEKYDVVLFEMVAPKDAAIPQNGKKKSDHPVTALQNMMTKILELEFQLDGVDYSRDNFVHADMSPEEFNKSMSERKESFLGMFLRSLGYAMTQPSGTSGSGDAQLLMALFDKNRALALKRVMAGQFQDMGGVLAVLDGPNGSTLITERNKVALAVLKKQLATGTKKVAIFYGAGHLPDMAKRLEDDFGMKPKDTRWLRAWDLRDEKSKSDKDAKDKKSAGAKVDQ
ncbi:MAG: hypothetical protein JXM70_24470 [Pirellulales bacterium]|nr:hypothetical protein [Pirellulales bacterium]